MAVSQNPVAKAIYTKLTGASALTDLLASGSSSVYEDLAPENADPAYVIFQLQSPSVPQRALGGGSVVYENALYTIRGVTDDMSAAKAGTIADKIDDALDNQTLTITGYTSLACLREQDVAFTEVDAGKRYNHRGAIFRVWADPS